MHTKEVTRPHEKRTVAHFQLQAVNKVMQNVSKLKTKTNNNRWNFIENRLEKARKHEKEMTASNNFGMNFIQQAKSNI